MNIDRRTVLKAALSTPAVALMHGSVADATTKIRVKNSVPGATPFISNVTISGVPVSSLQSIEFMVQPKKGSTTKGIGATYTPSYLRSKGLTNPATGEVTIPVFGLYASNAISRNVVTFTIRCRDLKTVLSYPLITKPWVDPTGGGFSKPVITQARDPKVALGFSTFLMKGWSNANTPVISDTDGEVRWVPPTTSTVAGPTSGFFNNALYLGSGNELIRADLNGVLTTVASYDSYGYTNINEHNIDPGKTGMLIEAATATDNESCFIEVDGKGAILHSWNFATIISEAMIAGGDDPSAFVVRSADWFHSNAAAYWKLKNQLIVSSRENFVIAIDYDTHKIKWILGDSSKAWYSYPSLRAFALKLAPGTTAPIGNHAISITAQNELLLFDNGAPSTFEVPAGNARNYSVARKYAINQSTMTATEVWNFNHTPQINSPYTSSVYQAGSSYLIDYAFNPTGPLLVGLGANNKVAFQYTYPGGSVMGWNAVPVDLTNLIFTA
ncbi:MAG: aryl-sulfate sulfotransferase [Acidimicrobiaceae bacterium]